VTLAPPVAERIQLCGPLVIEKAGRRWEGALPGRQGRLLFAYLVLNRHRLSRREDLAEALWGEQVPAAGDAGLNALISKLRKALGPDVVSGRATLRLVLSPDAWVDVEVAEDAVHKAESRVALKDWTHAWGPSLSALFIAERTFLPEDDAPWIEDRRTWLADIHLRALEAYAAAALGTGGTELTAAVRAGRQLVRLVPLRESGYQVLMQALAEQGNAGEALLVHADLCRVLRDELGVSPSAATQQVYETLLHA
jgi:SARP family transcriptional regulator, regulator of embCAB operon